MEFVLAETENIVGKEEKAGYQPFLLFEHSNSVFLKLFVFKICVYVVKC